MPYTKTDFPDSLKNLPEKIKNKAVDIINSLLEAGYEEARAIAIGTWKAEKMYDYKPLGKRKKSTIINGVMRTYCYIGNQATTETEEGRDFEEVIAKKKRKKMKGKDPCWEGYEMIGLKPDGNPNCVPKKSKKANFDGSGYKFSLEIPVLFRKELSALFEQSDKLFKVFLAIEYDKGRPKTNKKKYENEQEFFMDWAERTYGLIKRIPENKEIAMDKVFLKDGRVASLGYKKMYCSALKQTHDFFLNRLLSQSSRVINKSFINENFMKIVKDEVEKYLTLENCF